MFIPFFFPFFLGNNNHTTVDIEGLDELKDELKRKNDIAEKKEIRRIYLENKKLTETRIAKKKEELWEAIKNYKEDNYYKNREEYLNSNK